MSNEARVRRMFPEFAKDADAGDQIAALTLKQLAEAYGQGRDDERLETDGAMRYVSRPEPFDMIGFAREVCGIKPLARDGREC